MAITQVSNSLVKQDLTIVGGTVDNTVIGSGTPAAGTFTTVAGALASTVTGTTAAASDNSTKIATTAYVTTALANLVDSAPGTLNTLNELAAALGDDASFATTVTNSIATKAALAGATFTGSVQTTGASTYFISNSSSSGDYIRLYAGSGTGKWDIYGNGANLRIGDNDSAGNVIIDTSVGIGTTSPSRAPLHIHQPTSNTDSNIHLTSAVTGSNSGDGFTISVSPGGAGDTSVALIQRQNAEMKFYTHATERMRIDSSGRVGIFNSSPVNYTGAGARSLVVGSNSSASDPHGITIVAGSSSTSNLAFTDNAGSGSANDYRGLFQYAHSDDSLRIFVASTERMRIDSSGNVLIGKTVTTQSTAGTVLYNNGQIYATTAGSQSLVLSRTSSDGVMALFYKDSGEVGRIASDSGSMLMGSGDVGVYFDSGSDRILPMNMSTLGVRNDAIDIGGNPHRFKDLYLSGGVYVGGTGSANYLDDYEEGTLTFGNLTGYLNVTGTPSQTYAEYTKIGSLIHIQASISVTPTSTGRTGISLTVPFVMHSSSNVGLLGVVTAYPYNTDNGTGPILNFTGANNTQVYIETNVTSTATTNFTIQMTYRT